MIERLRRALEHVEELSLEMQDELAEIIEEQTEPLEDEAPTTPEQGLRPGEENLPPRIRRALAAIGSWRDLQDDDEFEALDTIRHSNPPSPPLDLDDL
ncbi:MAG: hypothetical protein ACRDHE_09890 [Ktedonobacterales bacterium]